MNLIEAYKEGNTEFVWQQLEILGSTVWDSENYETAWAICNLACLSFKDSIEHAIKVLTENKYYFSTPVPGSKPEKHEPVYPPAENTISFLEWLEGQCGRIGMMPKAFVSIIGDVNLNGILPAWGNDFVLTDPFIFEVESKRYGDAKNYFLETYEMYEEEDDLESFGIDFAPDDLHKANISGGAPYSICLPANGINPMVDIGGSRVGFVEYLNLNLKAGFFLGFEGLKETLDKAVIDQILENVVPI